MAAVPGVGRKWRVTASDPAGGAPDYEEAQHGPRDPGADERRVAVINQPGKVLTTYQPSAANVAAEYVFSRETFKATVTGIDPAGLALLQMEGASRRPFSTVTVGNSDMVVSSEAAIREKTYHVSGQVIDTALSTTATGAGVSLEVGP